MRIIVYTGKGGVGKTSVAAATALRCADMGYRTLVLSTDSAHSLGDSLQTELGPEPLQVASNLSAQEIDVHYSIDKYWGIFQEFLVSVFTRHGAQDVIAEEVTILPGLEEGASLLWLNEYVEQDAYDVIVIDAAPTAETLRLLSLPEVTRWWWERFLPIGRVAARVLGPVARPFGVDAPDADAINAVQQLFDSLDSVRAMLGDGEIASMRLVINAERMVIKETQRTYTYLNLYGYPVDAVVCNRLLPANVRDPYFQAWKRAQSEHLVLIHECFDPLPLLTAPLFREEVGGFERLRKMGAELFDGRDPAERLFRGQGHILEPDGPNGYVLRLLLPFTDKSAIDLYRSTDEITLMVGNYRRNIVLPRALWNLEVTSARMLNGELSIHFEAADDED